MADQWASTADHVVPSTQDSGGWASTQDHSPAVDTSLGHRIASGFKAGLGLSEDKGALAGALDTLKQVSGYNAYHDVVNQWEQGNHAQAAASLVKAAFSNPATQAGEGMVQASKKQFDKATTAVKEGRFADALIHGSAAIAVPLSPTADAAEKLESGDYAGAFTQMGTNIGSMFIPGMVGKVLPKVLPAALAERMGVEAALPGPAPLTPEGAFAASHDIPIPRSVETGSKVASATESHLANALGGSGVMKKAATATREGLSRAGARIAEQAGPEATPQSAGEALQAGAESRASAVEEAKAAQDAAIAQRGQDIATEVHPTPQTPESAGVGVAGELTAAEKAAGKGASDSYSRLRDIEADPANTKTITVGNRTVPTGVVDASWNAITRTEPITKDIALPVDMRPVKTSLQPVYDELKRTMPVAQQQASRGLRAIENIINGDDYVSASTADTNLGAVKAIEREAPNDKTTFLARKAIDAFSPAVDKAISSAGPEAADALNQGRALTRAKYATRDTFEQLPDEPVRIYRTLTAPGDANINLLRDVKAKAPGSIPALGRAMIQGLMDDAQASGISKAANAWGQLGDATKLELLGDADKVSTVDKYFKTASDLESSPVPAGMEGPGSAVAEEPVRAYSRLVQGKDVAINALKEAAQTNPASVPLVARAKLQEIIDMATAPEGEAKPGTALSAWNNMGDATKELLYPDPMLRKQVGDLLSTAKKSADAIDRNTSKTAYVNEAGKLMHASASLLAGKVAAAGTLGIYPALNYALAKYITSPGGAYKLARAISLAGKATALTGAESAQISATANEISRASGKTEATGAPAQSAAPKTASMSDIQTYALQNKIPLSAAMKEFEDNGYTVAKEPKAKTQ